MEKYAVITGASSGIGAQFAKLLAQDHYHLILVARREKRLKSLAETLDTKCDIIVADLSHKDECYRLYDQIKNLYIEIFINNAGFGDCGVFLDTDINKEIDMINLNIKALHILTKLIVQHMQKQNFGYILNVASSAGLTVGGPYMSTYYATKSYVTSLTCGIAKELKDRHSQVYIGCLCPGPVNTEFNQVANVEFALKGISASYCAKYGLKKMFRKKVIIIPTIKMKLAITLGKLLPTSLYIHIIAHQQKRKINKV